MSPSPGKTAGGELGGSGGHLAPVSIQCDNLPEGFGAVVLQFVTKKEVAKMRFVTKSGTIATALFMAGLVAWPTACSIAAETKGTPPIIRSARSGPWSAPGTWDSGKVPAAGARVQIRQRHTLVYDVKSDQAIRWIHVAGTLRFAHDRDTRLNVGLNKIQPGEDASEDGFECDAHVPQVDPAKRPALEVGTPERPIEATHTALIRLVAVEWLDKRSFAAIHCCGVTEAFTGTPNSWSLVQTA